MDREEFLNTKIPVVEIFQSVSGEGISAGTLVVFLRVAGCNLCCTWCDTKYSFAESGDAIQQLTPEEILDRISAIGSKELICTGGEPLEEDKYKRWLPLFLAAKGYKARVETSGGSPLLKDTEFGLFPGAKDNITYCMDIKCPGSGMANKNILTNIPLLKTGDELKFVVKDFIDLDFSFDVIDAYKKYLSENDIAINISPVFDAIKPEEIIGFLKTKTGYMAENGLWVRLSLQIHKYIWPPYMRGV